MSAYEVNFDGLVGPTHNYSGLSVGNLASTANTLSVSHPKQAALEGLKKMRFLYDLGIKQAVLPPHERPFLPALRQAGFTGSDEDILSSAWKNTPEMLLRCSSAAAMWTANAATVSPSPDCRDNKVHITPANLQANFHRQLEAPQTTKVLRKIFSNPEHFTVHDPLESFPDEGAANHLRFCGDYGKPGIELFVFGKSHEGQTTTFPARQTFEASQAISLQHGLNLAHTLFVKQNPEVIDLGVFHNDVISVGNQNVFFYHEKAFMETSETMQKLAMALKEISDSDLFCLNVKESEVTVEEAVRTYLFNSQLVSTDNGMVIIAPNECSQSETVKEKLDSLIGSLITEVHYLDVRESMKNGGGPACLRLRVVLNEAEISAMHQGTLLNDSLFDQLEKWIRDNYRDELRAKDLSDPQLLNESRSALDQLTKILQLGSLYSFQ